MTTPIVHVVRIRLRPETPPDVRARIDALNERLAASDAADELRLAPDLTGEYDFGLVAVLRDADAFDRYMEHPLHVPPDELAGPWVAAVESFDLAGPAVAERVAAARARVRERVERLRGGPSAAG